MGVFQKADVLALGDTFWNGIYPYIDNEDGGNIDGAINWANQAVARTTDHTIVVPGHGPCWRANSTDRIP